MLAATEPLTSLCCKSGIISRLSRTKKHILTVMLSIMVRETYLTHDTGYHRQIIAEVILHKLLGTMQHCPLTKVEGKHKILCDG